MKRQNFPAYTFLSCDGEWKKRKRKKNATAGRNICGTHAIAGTKERLELKDSAESGVYVRAGWLAAQLVVNLSLDFG